MTGRTRSTRARGVALPWAILVSITSLPLAVAQSTADVDAARAFFVEGTRLGNEGRWAEARELYARSLQLRPAPLTRYSLGVAQRETGRGADAVASFRAFLAEPPTPATAPYAGPARAAIVALESSLGPVTAGVAVGAGVSVVLAPTLTPAVPAAPPRTIPIVLLSLGGALLGAGLTVGLVGVTQASHAPTRDGADATAARAKGIAGDVMGTLGIATAAAGLVVLLVQGRSSPGQAGAASVFPSASGLGLRF